MNRSCEWLALTALVFGGPAVAQTCAAPAEWLPPAGVGNTITGTTCGGDTTAAGYCAGNLDAPGPAYVLHATFNDNRTITTIALVGGSGYDAILYVSRVSDGCGTNAPCIASADSTSPINATEIPNGDYYFIVTAATFDLPGACGTFTVSSDGSVPVELVNYVVT